MLSGATQPSSEIVSYRTLRRVVGVLGVALPIVLAVWGFALFGEIRLEPSISDYYELRTRDVFVGVLFAIGWFLFTYRGYDERDDHAGNLACVFALGVALFPNGGSRGEHIAHVVSATALFLVLAYFSFFLFTLSDAWPTAQKLVRNRIYRTCGVAIGMCIVAIAGESIFADVASPNGLSPVFWLESAALWAFGISWFVKGETVFKDGRAPSMEASTDAHGYERGGRARISKPPLSHPCASTTPRGAVAMTRSQQLAKLPRSSLRRDLPTCPNARATLKSSEYI